MIQIYFIMAALVTSLFFLHDRNCHKKWYNYYEATVFIVASFIVLFTPYINYFIIKLGLQ